LYVRFHFVSGSNFTSDCALDLVRFMESPGGGCIDPFAANYDSTATLSNNSCLYPGCTNPMALNYCSSCNSDCDTLAGGTNDSCCIFPLCSTIPFYEDFESANFNTNQWLTNSGTEAVVGFNLTSAIADSVSLEFSGGTITNYGITPYSEAAAFDSTTKIEHFASATLCLDLSGATTPEMSFLVAMPGSFNNAPYRWLRILANGNVIADVNGNTSFTNTLNNVAGSVGLVTDTVMLTFDLLAYIGLSDVHITFQTSCRYGPAFSLLNAD
ncbi:uncharacterized protein METZ01_LOCUS426024, partial [marine metagenome]